MNKDCPICEGPVKWIKTINNKDGIDYRIYRCLLCGLVFSPVKMTASLNEHYDQKYYFNSGCDTRVNPHRLNNENLVVKSILNFLGQEQEKRKFLDVGCGDGVHLELFKRAGWIVHGTEISPEAIKVVKDLWGIEPFYGHLKDANFPFESFDYIQMRHVIEHLINPVENVNIIHHLLKPGGIFRIDTPTIGLRARVSLAIRKLVDMVNRFFMKKLENDIGFGDCHPPEHNFWFSRKAMHILLKQSGFVILESICTYRGNPLHYPPKRNIHRKNWMEWIKYHLSFFIDYLGGMMNLGDILVIYAQKQQDR